MKDETSTPTTDGTSPNEFEEGKPGTTARSSAEAAIEELRQRGGVFVNAVRSTRMPMALTDPTLPGNPIIFANESFLKLSGYSMEEVLGQHPHFMNGPDTDPDDTARFAEAIRADQDDIVETVQYRKNGSRFVATVLISAFKDEEGRIANHFMSWLDVTRRVDAEAEVADRRAVQMALSEELRNTNILQDLAARLVTEENVQTVYEEILSAAIQITNAKAGTVQRLDPQTEELVVIAARGFSKATMDYFHRIDASSRTSCGLALRCGDRSYFTFDRASDDKSARLHADDGVLSAQFSPLLSRAGKPIGMVSMHFAEPAHSLSERELRFLDLLVRQAGDLLEQRAAEQARIENERRTNNLLAELQHRVRNTLAVVRSISRRTAERSETVDEMLSHFEGRLNAFSRVQSAVTRSADGAVKLKSLIEDEMVAVAARDGPLLHVDGPEILLKANAAESLSLAIHELTTNAVKYGALSNRRGRLKVRWRLALNGRGEQLELEWIESGLPETPDPSHEGFGHEMLRRTLPYDLGAETDIQFNKDGIRFTMRMPLGPDVLAEGA